MEKYLGVKAARKVHGPRNRPVFAAMAERTDDIHDWGMYLGMVDSSPLYAQHEDAMVVVAIPRSGKTLFISCGLVLDARGFVVATTTKADLVLRTIAARSRRGPVAVFDPQGIVGWPQTLRWNPITGCEVPDTALARGKAWTAAQPMEGTTNGSWFNDRAATILSCLLHAAAIDGRSMRDVARWAATLSTTEEPLQILTNNPRAAAGWDDKFSDITHSRADTTLGSVQMTLGGLLDPLSSPRVMDAVCPEPGEGIDIVDFIERQGTIYLVGSREAGSAAPLVTMLADHIVSVAKHLSQTRPGQRLDPPVRLVLDEAGTIAPLPGLPALMADSGGRGITTVVFCQSFAQMRQRWGVEGAEEIWGSASVRMVLGGLVEADHLERLSKLCGQHQVKRTSSSRSRGGGPGGGGTSVSTHYEWEPVMRPEAIQQLAEGRALMIYRNRKPALVKLRAVWQRMDRDELKADLEQATAQSRPVSV